MSRKAIALLAFLVSGTLVAAQVPQPFPRPQGPAQQPPAQPAPPKPAQPAAPKAPATGPTSPTAPVLAPAVQSAPAAGPTEAELGFPIYPNAQFLASYDAGRGQRYVLFGSEAAFTTLVAYYKTRFKTNGTQVFEAPLTHIFEVGGRFREDTMAFPPSVTIKDYTWNGSRGYLNPHPDAQPARFPTIIQFVPPPPGQKP